MTAAVSADTVAVQIDAEAVAGAAGRGRVQIAESLLSFAGRAGSLLGVLARPGADAKSSTVAVVIVVGGPQTRVGSHRQFVLLARHLAAAGFPCLRFDYTGMGDSPGAKPDFEEAGADIGLACDAALAALPGCSAIALWGLCDGATAAIFQAVRDERIAAVIAANPWARSDGTRSATMVREHYGSRFRSAAFWKKLLSGRVDIVTGAREFVGHLWRARRQRGAGRPLSAKPSGASPDVGRDLPVRLADALSRAAPRVHLQLSGNDLTAAEFELAMNAGGIGQRLSGSMLRLPQADHTFSDPDAWKAVIGDTISVLDRLRAE